MLLQGSWLSWLERSPLAAILRGHAWLYPAVEVGHILSFVVLIGAAAMFDFRLLGLSPAVSVSAMARHTLPWARRGLCIAVPTGVLLFITDATTIAANPAFQIKLGLIALALANAGIFHTWTSRSVVDWDLGQPTPFGAKFAGITSLALWTGVVTCGRLIAYI
jgi:hypothetical protein